MAEYLVGQYIWEEKKEIKGSLKPCKVDCVYKSNSKTAEEILFIRDLIRK